MGGGLAFGLSMLVSLAVCDMGRADDTKAGNDSKPAGTKAAENKAEAGLTDRERWLLERVEQLEKRVADLELKDGKPLAEVATAREKSAETGSSVYGGMTAATKPGPSAPAATLGSAPAGAVPSSMSASIAAAIGPKQDMSTSVGTPSTAQEKKKIEPFSDVDWTWLNGNPRTKEIFWDSKFFTPEIRAGINYVSDFNHPTDHSIGGSSELFRSNEVQLEQLGIGGDFHYDNVRARFMTQFGMYSVTTPRNDP